MDDFVRTKLVEWGLSEWVEKFEDQEIDKESIFDLDDREIENLITKAGPRVKFKKKLKLLKCEQEHEEAADVVQVLPSTSDTGKRKSDLQSDASRLQSPAKRQRLSMSGFPESIILSDVKSIMTFVHARLNDEDKLSAFLRKKISDLETDKRELVGVFGKTGAGKSSLINAIIKEKNLLPSGSVNACTSVMIKVEANTRSLKYEAEIEFITKEEWKDELWSFRQLLDNNENQEKEDNDDYRDAVEKLSALYGQEWRRSFENPMDSKYFKEIPEFLQSRRKILTCESANELSAKCIKYTRSDSKQEEGNEGKKWFWPLVKCVTVKVPNKPLLQHVTLVDLPGNGDCNKCRDQMWKGIVGDCSTVWIVTEINRAAAEKEAWEILESVSSLIGNGGECQQIHFICTKSDLLDDSDDLSSADIHDQIIKRNIQANDGVRKEFNKRSKIKKHFTDDSFKVFTVSSKEFLKGKHLSPEETEIPKLQGFLQELNDCHSETVNYVYGAYGILSLIQGANSRGVKVKKGEAYAELERIMILQLDNVNNEMEDTYTAFKKCLDDGVEKSKCTFGEKLKIFLYRGRNSGFCRVLKCVVENGGVHKPKNGTLINLNMKLASCLTDSIDEEFRKTFPNDSECGAFNGVIKTFSLNTDSLIEKYKNAELQLRFLKTEEEKIKAKLNRIIRKRKKKVYSSLTETIENIMKEGYKKAAEFRGEGMLYNMRETIKNHVHSKKDMFEGAKNTMLEKLHSLMRDILETLEETMKESFELSFKTDGSSLPDVSTELDMVKKHYHQLADEEINAQSLYYLDDREIDNLITKAGPRVIFKNNLKRLKGKQEHAEAAGLVQEEQNSNQEPIVFFQQCEQEHEEAADVVQVLPSTSSKGKRKSDLQAESLKCSPAAKRRCDSDTKILSEVKSIMKQIKDDINDKEELGAFIKNKISDLEIDKRELVGVFGRSGAGKSSLINAIIDEKNLLPTGSISACTSVMIKVEANTRSLKYEAEIEFIKKEEWHDELWSLKTYKKGDDDYRDMVKKLSALYGEEWRDKSPKNLIEPKYFKNIPEFLASKRKSLSCDTAQELSQKLRIYTKGGPKQEDGYTAPQWFWPLVKSVTVRVPHNELLQHVTLVDLPGNGDRNKSRNEMWKQIVVDCSTVWIVAEITRAASEVEAWEILKSAHGLIGNGGQCQQIHFICTKSDPADDRVPKNKEAKEEVMNEFQELSEQFSDKGFKVFTVSADEFLKRKRVKEDDNEIPKLQDFLQNLNDCHSETVNYVNGAYGILSLIEGARCSKAGVGKADDVCKVLEKNMREQLDQVKRAVDEAMKDFEQCLTEGVKNSKTSEEKLKFFLDRDQEPSFFKTLEAVVWKYGIHQTKKGEQINLNTVLASCLTDSIDEEFRKTFPNDVKGGSFNGVISRFSLDTKSLIQKYQDVKLQLIFLQTEEDKIKAKLNKIILKGKKIIYNSLTETIEKNMKKCYEDARKISGTDALKKMRKTIETHVSSNRNMYEDAKKTMMKKMNILMTIICKELEETMVHSIKHSLKASALSESLPDVSEHLETVQQHYSEVKRSQEGEMTSQ